jgi:hypothetical protein
MQPSAELLPPLCIAALHNGADSMVNDRAISI